MRVLFTPVVMLVALCVSAPLSAQDKQEEKPVTVPTSRTILANLQIEFKSAPYAQSMKFSELLQLARADLESKGREVTFAVDDEAFREETGADRPAIHDVEIFLSNLPTKTSIQHILRQALQKLPFKAAMVVRAGKVEILPFSRTSKEHMLNQTFHLDLKERRLDLALEELSELTGVSIVMDARAKQKGQTGVTARFHDDVALQDAVRMLTDMAELKIVYLVTGMYVTTPEHAAVMQKELKQIYEGPAPLPFGMPPGAQIGPSPFPSIESPLAPPLPPLRKRLEAAA